MEIKSEFHKTQKTLFRRVNQIRKINGTCDFEPEGKGYRLNYCESGDLGNVYVVQNGKDGAPFRLHDGLEGAFFHLDKGEILIYQCESDNKVWFSYPKWLERFGETDLDLDLGFTDYGSLSEMMQAGLIINARQADRPLFVTASGEMKEKPLHDVAPKQANSEEPQAEADPVADIPIVEPVKDDQTPTSVSTTAPVEGDHMLDEAPPEYGSFDTINKVFDILKSAVEDIALITRYSSKNKETGIRTLKVRRGWYHYDYGWRNNYYKEVPEMQLRGFWLENAGFMRGDFVQVITIRDMMLLVPVRPPKNWDE